MIRTRFIAIFSILWLGFASQTALSCEGDRGIQVLKKMKEMLEPTSHWGSYDQRRAERRSPLVYAVYENNRAYFWSPLEALASNPLEKEGFKEIRGYRRCVDSFFILDGFKYSNGDSLDFFTEDSPPPSSEGQLTQVFNSIVKNDLLIVNIGSPASLSIPVNQHGFFGARRVMDYGHFKRVDFHKNWEPRFDVDPISKLPRCLDFANQLELKGRLLTSEESLRNLLSKLNVTALPDAKKAAREILNARTVNLNDASKNCLNQVEWIEARYGVLSFPSMASAAKFISPAYLVDLYRSPGTLSPHYSGAAFVYLLKFMDSRPRPGEIFIPNWEKRLESADQTTDLNLVPTPARLLRNSLAEFRTF